MIAPRAVLIKIAVGFIIKPRQAEEIVASGKADIVAIAREMMVDPFWTAHAARELGVDRDYRTLPPAYAWWLAQRQEAGRGA